MKTKTFKILLVALLLSAILFSGFAFPEVYGAAQNSLTIRVLNDSNNQPVADARVTISGPANLTAITNSDGRVVFSNIPAGSYSVVTSGPNSPASAPQTITVNGEASAALVSSFTLAFFTYTPDTPQPNDSILFNASYSTSSGVITGYSWDFGDGTYGTNITTSHTYSKNGVYRVALTVMSTSGAAAYTQTINMTTPDILPYVAITILLFILLPLLLFLLFKRKRYYIVIQARIPPKHKHPHCPGNGDCDNCKVTPC